MSRKKRRENQLNSKIEFKLENLLLDLPSKNKSNRDILFNMSNLTSTKRELVAQQVKKKVEYSILLNNLNK